MRSVSSSCCPVSSPALFTETILGSGTSQGLSTTSFSKVWGNFFATLLVNSSDMLDSFPAKDFIDQVLDIPCAFRRLSEQIDRCSLARCLGNLRVLANHR